MNYYRHFAFGFSIFCHLCLLVGAGILLFGWPLNGMLFLSVGFYGFFASCGIHLLVALYEEIARIRKMNQDIDAIMKDAQALDEELASKNTKNNE